MRGIKEVRQVKVRGKKRWQARVQYAGRRLLQLCDSHDEAKAVRATLVQ